MDYTPHEIRTIIRNCNTMYELQQAEFNLLMIDAFTCSALRMQVYKQALLKQRLVLMVKERL